MDEDFDEFDDGDGFDPGYDWTEDDGQPSDLQEHQDFEQADEHFGMFDGE